MESAYTTNVTSDGENVAIEKVKAPQLVTLSNSQVFAALLNVQDVFRRSVDITDFDFDFLPEVWFEVKDEIISLGFRASPQLEKPFGVSIRFYYFDFFDEDGNPKHHFVLTKSKGPEKVTVKSAKTLVTLRQIQEAMPAIVDFEFTTEHWYAIRDDIRSLGFDVCCISETSFSVEIRFCCSEFVDEDGNLKHEFVFDEYEKTYAAPIEELREKMKPEVREQAVELAKEVLKEGAKFDDSKNMLSLIPPQFLEGLGEILTFGANKYAARNWEKGIDYDRVYSALQRHLIAWWGGEKNDPETGKSHLYHAACNIVFLSEFERRGLTQFDKREAS